MHQNKLVLDSHCIVRVNATSPCDKNRSRRLAAELCEHQYKRPSTTGSCAHYERETSKIKFPKVSTYSVQALSSKRDAAGVKFSPSADCEDYYGIYNTMNYLEKSGKYATNKKSCCVNVNGNKAKSSTRKMIKSVFPKYGAYEGKTTTTEKLVMQQVMKDLSEEGKQFAEIRSTIEGMVSYNGSLNAEAAQSAGSSAGSLWSGRKPRSPTRNSLRGSGAAGLLSRSKSQIDMSSGVIIDSPSMRNKAKMRSPVPSPKKAVSFFDKGTLV